MLKLAPLVLLDVNETLLDLAGLDPVFEEAFGSAEWRAGWFRATLALAMKNTDAGEYHDFPYTGELALKTLAHERDREIPGGFQERLNKAIVALPLHPDVPEGIRLLKAGGYRVGVLANNPVPVVTAQLRHAGIFNSLDAVLSADNARQLKPGQRAYEYALRESGAEATETWMVAAHVWDIRGAMAAGLRGAYLSRQAAWPDGEHPAPQVSAATLPEAAQQILKRPVTT
ncbi:haloacid dehalogenase type II [Deinococcus sp.]|uniref:haloacid dehalogenase type II n=1 Tax=Deinococcus sp. TaxID=47478 RepID=UPI003C7A62F2